MSHRIRACHKQLMRFKVLKLLQLVFVVYIVVLSFGPWSIRDEETGYFIDPDSADGTEAGLIHVNGTDRAIAATSTFQVACLALARLSAWFMYPSKFQPTSTVAKLVQSVSFINFSSCQFIDCLTQTPT